jgi:nucleoside-diphosphate-sugar epimerase
VPADGIEWVKIAPIGPGTDWSGPLEGGISHVVHLAGIAHHVSPDDEVADAVYDEVNHLGTAGLASAFALAPAARRFVFVSSIKAVASQADEPISEKTRCCPDTPYGRSKLSAENAIEVAFRDSPVEWCILRPPLIYGLGNQGNMGRLIRLLSLHLPLPLGSVQNRRTFLYIGNLTDAIRVALEHPAAARQMFCIGDGRLMSTPELMRGLGKASNLPVRLFPFPLWGIRLICSMGGLFTRLTGRSVGVDSQTFEKLCGSLPLDSSHFCHTCGWHPPFSVEQGLQATIGAECKR